LFAKYEVEFFPVKRRIADTEDTAADLPDFSADWKLIDPAASNAEIKARFYYEFARESETILSLTERLRSESHALMLLFYLQPELGLGFIRKLMSKINLRDTSWNQLKPRQRGDYKCILSRKASIGVSSD